MFPWNIDITNLDDFGGMMIRVLVVTHGDFGMHLLGAAQTILGPQDQCESMSVDATLDMNGL